jgi:hypothetical protein
LKINLNLRKHCIETEIRRLYNRSVSEYFKSGRDKERLEKKIDALKTLLEKSDFNRLRSSCSELAGHSDAETVLLIEDDRCALVLSNGEKIDLP